MKITCTTEEREILTESIVKSTLCPFPPLVNCPVEICQQESCVKCMNEKIEWEMVKDSEQK